MCIRDSAGADDGGRAEAAREPGRGDAEDGEAEGGDGGDQSGDGAAHAEARADLLEEGAEAGDGGPQVEGGQHDADDEDRAEPGGLGARGSGGTGLCGYRARGLGPVDGLDFFVGHYTIIESWDDWL